MSKEQLIQQLNELDTRIASFDYADALISWDIMTLAPKQGVEARATVMMTLSEMRFNALINDDVSHLIDGLNQIKDTLDPTTLAKLELYEKDINKIAKIPVKEYAAYEGLIVRSSQAWEKAKSADDFSIFAPFLDDIIKTQRRFIEYRGYEGHPYNTLLDDYEPGLTVETADRFFADLKEEIVPLVSKLSEMTPPNTDFLNQAFPIDQQKTFSTYIMEELGFRMDAGVLAESEHPFTQNLSKNDVRLTTHYHEEDLLNPISSTIHETGHGLYEQNIADELGVSRLSTGVSMGIHESQSRIYENNFGRSKAFWSNYLPKLQEMFPEQLKSVELDTFIQAMNYVRPSLIRIDADEVTYPLHIMIRYELEKKLMSEDVDIYDIPALWNDKYEEYLGVRPSSDKEGVLQDVHWSEGLFGYFPSYALGSAYAAQFEHYMRKDLDVDTLLSEGNLQPILDWLASHIHQYGSTKKPADIIQSATGEVFNPSYFVDYLTRKFSAIYNLD